MSSVPESEVSKMNETLYRDSFFRRKNNISNAKVEIRNLIRQTEFHCKNQNLNEKSTEELKFQLALDYFSIVDEENQEGLLPAVKDDFSLQFAFNSSLNINSELLKAKQACMALVQKGLDSYQETLSGNNQNGYSKSNSGIFSNNQQELNSTSVSGQLQFKRNDLSKNTSINQSEKGYNLISHKDNGTSLSNTSTNENKHPKRQKVNYLAENTPKRWASDNNDNTNRFSKRKNWFSNKETEPQPPKDLKQSFIPAISMYKNPLKKAKEDKKEKAAEETEFDNSSVSELQKHPTLKNFEAKIVNIIVSEIMDFSPDVKWSDIAGLEFVKSTVQEVVIWPLMRPDIFSGLRAPPKGILLFGPPGTGKTLIGKCIATESKSTFFCISASSLSSKYVGESEQLVRALFAVATLHQPAVIFIDEIDSLLSQRSDQEQDHTRKLKTEFLVQFDGAKTNSEKRVLVVGATNRPHELDEAARRRFVKRLYVPLPEKSARLQIIEKLLTNNQHNLSNEDFERICVETDGYSGSDVAHLCKEAAMGPIRSIGPEQIQSVSLDQVRPIELVDFLSALKQVRASVAQEDLDYYLDWNKKFGSFSI